MHSLCVGASALLLVTTTEEVAVWALYFWFSTVLGMVPSVSAVETTSTVPMLGGAYIHSVGILVLRGLIVASILSLAHYEV